ncbi:hypothetical protein Sjap_010146 [Stephania japonica]|uniref:TF-B3 domain-containing protein n=1 Tax=Stephania japonica TaxID=461633 RepID=A0AAP0J8V4_9MAGN
MVSKNISDNRNHFFIFMLPGYEKKQRIPKAFKAKRLKKVSNCKYAKICKRGETWLVNVRVDEEGMWFVNGWEEFVEDNEVGLGDLIVFEYKKNMVFDVLVLNVSGCEKDCSTSKNNTANKNKMDAVKKEDPLEAAEDYETSYPHFIKQMTATVFRCGVEIPIQFARSNSLFHDGRKVTLRNRQRKNFQNVEIKVTSDHSHPRGRVKLGSGTHRFLIANGVGVGDVCVFELDPTAYNKGKVVLDVKVFKGQKPLRSKK